MRQRPGLAALKSCIGLCLAALLATAAQAADRALLIGVADYPALPRRLWLHGPVNDVDLMRRTLVARGMPPSAIRTLVSRAAEQDEPTRAHITEAMAKLRQDVQPGDRVVFYLSGHGSQQPQPRLAAKHANRPLEPDAMDEVFLPADVRQWDGSGSQAAIPNALLDDEIGEWMDRLVDKGATVFGIFDTCHAGGMARGDGGRWRAVAGVELGLPLAKTAPAAARGISSARMDGRALAFAAGAGEAAGEEWLPRGNTAAANRMSRLQGVFTFHLADVLASMKAADSSAINGAIRRRYAVEKRAGPMPEFRGELGRMWP